MSDIGPGSQVARLEAALEIKNQAIENLTRELSMAWQVGYSHALIDSLIEEEKLQKQFKARLAELQTCPACGLKYNGHEAE